MTDWNEATLRGAASWKAFKEGKALCEGGAVSGGKADGNSWSGSVREGKRTFKAAVKVLSPTDLETRCGCPENQATGALCAHGVAAGLAALTGSNAKTVPPEKEAITPLSAFAISFPVNWREALGKGRFSATLSAGREITAADEKIAGWLAAMGEKPLLPRHLDLDVERTRSFLAAIADHPRVIVGKTGQAIVVTEGARIGIARLDREGGKVLLEGEPSGIVKIGGGWWRVGAGEISRIGLQAVGPELGKVFEALAAGNVAEVSLSELLENLEHWQEWLDFPEDSWLEEIHFVPAEAVFELRLEGSLQRLEATFRVRYGEGETVVPGLGSADGLPRLEGNRCAVRDWAGERNAVKRLEEAGFESNGPSPGAWLLVGEAAVVDFLSRALPELERVWKIEEGERYRVAKKLVSVVTPRIEIVGSGDDWLSFNLSFQSNDGSLIPAAEIRRLLSGGKSGSGKRIVVSESVSNLIEPLFSDLEIHQECGRFIASKRAGEVIKEIRNKISNSQFSNERTNCAKVDFAGLVTAELRPYQTRGAEWLLDRVEKFGGALLADDMGLGKTLQTIACIERLFREEGSSSGMVLVIATASLLGNWKAEFTKFAGNRSVSILHGSGRESQQNQAKEGEVLLTTFGTLPRDLAWYLKQSFLAVVVDEASLMRNPDTDHAKAIAKLKTGVRIALTGTPIENGVRDLWSIFRFIQPGWLGTREDFRERYELSAGEPGVLERLRLKTSPFMLRRTKEEVAPELPSKIFIEEFCELSSEQVTVYRDLLAEGRKKVEALQDSGNAGAARMQVLTALLRLRQTCCDLALLGNDRFKQLSVIKRSAKLTRLMELLEEAVSGGHKVLVFSQFSMQLREIENCISERGFASLKLDGQTRKRQEMVDKFQSIDGPPVFLISLKAGGYGLNLTAADTVIHFDPWWNPAAEAQATDRAHRIGQTRPVTVYRLIARGTVEEKVVSLQRKKREIAVSIDENGSGDAAGWTERELADLINS